MEGHRPSFVHTIEDLEGALHHDLHDVIGDSGFDVEGHGTKMAGLALYGPLDRLLTGSGPLSLEEETVPNAATLPLPRSTRAT